MLVLNFYPKSMKFLIILSTYSSIISSKSWLHQLHTTINKGQLHKGGRNIMPDLLTLKNALNAYDNKLFDGVLIDNDFISNITLTQSNHNYSTSANHTLANILSDGSVEDETPIQKFKHPTPVLHLTDHVLANTHFSPNLRLQQQPQERQNLSELNWHLIQFTSSLICFSLHTVWFLWLVCRRLVNRYKTWRNTYPTIQTDMVRSYNAHHEPHHHHRLRYIHQQQFILRIHIHLSLIGALYGLVMSLGKLLHFIVTSKFVYLDYKSIMNKNYLICSMTRRIALSLLTIYWLTILVDNTIQIKFVNYSTKHYSHKTTFVTLYLTFITLWLVSIATRVGSVLIIYLLQNSNEATRSNKRQTSHFHILASECELNISPTSHSLDIDAYKRLCQHSLLDYCVELTLCLFCDIIPIVLVISFNIFLLIAVIKLRKTSPIHNDDKLIDNRTINDELQPEQLNLTQLNEIELHSSNPRRHSVRHNDSTPSVVSYMAYQCDAIDKTYSTSINDCNTNMSSDTVPHLYMTPKSNRDYLYIEFNQHLFTCITLILMSSLLLLNHSFRLIIFIQTTNWYKKLCNNLYYSNDIICKFSNKSCDLYGLTKWILQKSLLIELGVMSLIPLVIFIRTKCKLIFCIMCIKYFTNYYYNKKQKSELCPLNNYQQEIINSNSDSIVSNVINTANTNTTNTTNSSNCLLPPCELLKLKTFTRSQFEKKFDFEVNNNNLKLQTDSSLSVDDLECQMGTKYVPVSVQIVNLQPLCCGQTCSLDTNKNVKDLNKFTHATDQAMNLIMTCSINNQL